MLQVAEFLEIDMQQVKATKIDFLEELGPRLPKTVVELNGSWDRYFF